MKAALPPPAVAVLLALSAPWALGQASSKQTFNENPPAHVEVSGPTERVSKQTRSAVTAGMGTYNPPPPPKPVETPRPAVVAENAKLDEAGEEGEQPRNGIVRLPRYIVEDRPPVLAERDLYTKQGLRQVAASRYLSELDRGVLNRFTLPLFGMSSEQRAMMIYEEEERQKNINEATDRISILKQSDPVAAQKLQSDVQSTFIRRSDFTPTAGTR